MSVKFASSIDLNKLELQNAVIQHLASAPGSPSEGQIYYNTTDDKLYLRNASTWVDLTAQGGGTPDDNTVTSAKIVDGAIMNADVNASAAIAESKLSLASDAAAGTASRRTLGTGATQACAGNDSRLSNERTPADNTVTSAKIVDGAIMNADVNASAAIALSKLATDPLARANHTGTQAQSTVTNLTTDLALKAPLASPTFTGNVTVPDGSSSGHAVNKGQLDAISAGLDFKGSVRLASTANVASISGNLSIDGSTTAAGDRILLKDQTTKSQNGIYVAAAGAWTRATDADSAGELSGGTYVFVEEGTAQADTGWVITTNGSITPGTTAHDWAIFSRAGELTAGDGLSKTGGSLAVDSTVARRNADNTITGNVIASKATTGTDPVVSGTTSSTGVGVTGAAGSGGTGVRGTSSGSGGIGVYGSATVAGGAGVVGLGSSGAPAFAASSLHSNLGPVFDGSNNGPIVNISNGVNDDDAATLGQVKTGVGTHKENCGTSATWNIDHNLNTLDVQVEIVRVSDGATVLVDVARSTVNRVVVTFAAAPTSAQYRALIRTV
jgi:hypothetical protein